MNGKGLGVVLIIIFEVAVSCMTVPSRVFEGGLDNDAENKASIEIVVKRF
jgi:hypothetical protein